LKQPGVRGVIRRTAERAARDTGDGDLKEVSSRDRRRRFAKCLLVDERMNPRIVIATSG